MERITEAYLERRVQNLNLRLKRYRSKRRVRIGGRYNYTAIDEYGTDGNYYGCIAAGTKRECWDAVTYMMRAIDMEHQR